MLKELGRGQNQAWEEFLGQHKDNNTHTEHDATLKVHTTATASPQGVPHLPFSDLVWWCDGVMYAVHAMGGPTAIGQTTRQQGEVHTITANPSSRPCASLLLSLVVLCWCSGGANAGLVVTGLSWNASG
jgi:hypothetical protein